MDNHILIIGNSFVEGVGADGKNGWAQILSTQYKSNMTISGVGGDTIKKILARFPKILDKKHQLVILEVGINDSRYRPSLKSREVELTEFLRGLNKFYNICKDNNSALVLIGLTRVDENFTVPYKEDKEYHNDNITIYDKAIKKFADENELSYISIPPLNDNEKLLIDGIHPSNMGHSLLFEAIFNALKKRLS